MSLAAVVDALATRLAQELDAGTRVGDASPSAPAELPAVTLAVSDVTERVAGVGRVPRGTRTGALAVSVEVDLSAPTLDLGGGETLLLVPADRRSLVLPHGPLVRADGTPDDPFTAADLQVRDPSTWSVVAAAPSGRQVRPDVDAGLLRFGQPLPNSGTLRVQHFIGTWDVVVSRYQGRLDVRIAADTVAVGPLSRRVADVLGRPSADMRLAPRAWGAAARPPAGGLSAQARVQQLGYVFDTELERPLLSSGGGVITDVAVTLRAAEKGQTRTESFDIVRTP